MKKVWIVNVLLYEDGPVHLGTFDSEEKAEACAKAAREGTEDEDPWDGPNVQEIRITSRDVK